MVDADTGTYDRIYHVAFESDWVDAQATGEYRTSTRGRGLEEVGYIHAAFRHQVEPIGTLIFGDVSEPLVVLAIDRALLTSPVRVENLEGGTESFPHIYGPLPTSAVIQVLSARVDNRALVVEGLSPDT